MLISVLLFEDNKNYRQSLSLYLSNTEKTQARCSANGHSNARLMFQEKKN